MGNAEVCDVRKVAIGQQQPQIAESLNLPNLQNKARLDRDLRVPMCPC
jgi:hypothetical protein